MTAAESEVATLRQLAYLTPERPGRTWKDAFTVAQYDAEKAEADLAVLRQECAQEENFRQRLSAEVGCSSPDGSAEIGIIQSIKAELAQQDKI